MVSDYLARALSEQILEDRDRYLHALESIRDHRGASIPCREGCDKLAAKAIGREPGTLSVLKARVRELNERIKVETARAKEK